VFQLKSIKMPGLLQALEQWPSTFFCTIAPYDYFV